VKWAPDMVKVERICGLAGFSRQAYYKQCVRRSRQEVDEDAVVELVRAERRIQPRLGVRKLAVVLAPDLAEMGIALGRDRLFSLLGERDLLLVRPRRGARTTDSRHGFKKWPNLIRHIEVTMPHQVLVSDLTYIRTDERFVYLSLVMDAYSRMIVGYDMNDTLEAEGCLRALRMALGQLPADARPIHHSDRGTQYCCAQYVAALEQRDCSISMTEIDHCYENAKAERLNGILKQEYALGETFRNKQAALEAVNQAVALYNERRPHTALKYRTPAQAHRDQGKQAA
jgi:putative transposase